MLNIVCKTLLKEKKPKECRPLVNFTASKTFTLTLTIIKINYFNRWGLLDKQVSESTVKSLIKCRMFLCDSKFSQSDIGKYFLILGMFDTALSFISA